MPLSALLLLILSALLHAAYYGFYKRSADKQVFVPSILVTEHRDHLMAEWRVSFQVKQRSTLHLKISPYPLTQNKCSDII